MEKTTININKRTAERIALLAEKEKRSVSSQIDYIIEKYFNERNEK